MTMVQGQTILVAEDDQALRKLVADVLEESGFKVLTAADGTSALKAARAHKGPIDMLITDVMMPHLDGFDLREQFLVERGDVRILVISGALDPEITGEDFAILRKPFMPKELLAKVHELFNASVLAQSAGEL